MAVDIWGASLTMNNMLDLSKIKGPILLGLPIEANVLARYAKLARKGIVEIGCNFGGSSAVLVAHSNVHVWSIDPFVGDAEKAIAVASFDVCRAGVHEAVGDEAYKRWGLAAGYSYDVVRMRSGYAIANNPFDVLFIDGDHRYEGVRRDVDDWLPLLAPGGYMLLHDANRQVPDDVEPDKYHLGNPGPTRVARELDSDARVRRVETRHSIAVFQKVEH